MKGRPLPTLQHTLVTPFGELHVYAVPEGICAVEWDDAARGKFSYRSGDPFDFLDLGPRGYDISNPPPAQDFRQADSHATEAIRQLREYFQGKRRAFDLPLIAQGTEFQNDVWTALRDIPYGETCSYKEISIRIGRPLAVRAVGQANRHNPYPIIVPCHRVMGSNGQMTGYAGDRIDLKSVIIELELEFVHQERMAARRAQA